MANLTNRFNIYNFINLLETESNYDRFMYLKLYVVNDEELKEKYTEHINNHLAKLFNKISYADAGFDILSPKPNDNFEYERYGGIPCYGINWSDKNPVNKIDFRIKCSAEIFILNRFHDRIESGRRFINHQTGYYMYPRSSLSKTNLRLANNTGIIDAGYRGNLIGMFDVVNATHRENSLCDYLIEPYTRLLQICSPSLVPIYVELIDEEINLGERTVRGEGGFGSTGI
jgi:dUTPase